MSLLIVNIALLFVETESRGRDDCHGEILTRGGPK